MSLKTKFNPIFLTMLMLVCMAMPVLAQDDAPKSFTLDECIEYALEHNENLKNAELDKAISRQQVIETRSQGLPQINGSANVNHNISIRPFFFPANFTDPNAPEDLVFPVQAGAQYDADVGVSVSQMIFDGSYFVGLEAAKTYKELSEKQLTQTKRDVRENVMKGYYLVLVNQERTELVNNNIQRLDSLYEETNLMYENGFAEKTEVDRVKVSRNNFKVEKEKTETVLRVSKYMLKRYMGLPVQEDVAFEGSLKDATMELGQAGQTTDFNYSERIEYSQLQTQMALQNLDIRNYKMQYVPKLNLSFNAGVLRAANNMGTLFEFGEDSYMTQGSDGTPVEESFDRWPAYSAVGLSLQVPIFSGFRRNAKVQQAELNLRKLENQFDQLENSIDTEIMQAKANYNNSIQALKVQKENLELAQDVYETTKTKYQNGVGSNLEVINADNSLKESQTNYYNAVYQAIVAKINYQKAIGKF